MSGAIWSRLGAPGRSVSLILRYGVAIASVALALLTTLALNRPGIRGTPFIPAIIVTAWYGGIGPGLFAAGLSLLAMDHFIMAPRRIFRPVTIDDAWYLLVFALSALLVAWITGTQRRTKAELQKAHDDLTARIGDLALANERLQAEVLERRRVEAEAYKQASLLDLTHDSVFVRDLNDVITYWNRGAAERYGWSGAEAVGRVSHQLTQTAFPAQLPEIEAELYRTGQWEGELVHTKRDGTQVVVASRWSLQRDQQGRPAGVLETNNDITERRRAEDALRRTQETYLAEAQQLSQTGSFGWYAASGEIFWSEESFRIFGYDKTVKPSIALIFQRVHPDDAALVQKVIDRAAHDQQDFDFEHRLMMPDGSVKHLHVVAHAVRDEPGKLHFIGALMDITARKEADRAVRESEQRYRHLFDHMPMAMWQLDGRGLAELFNGLRAAGVTDLGTYLDQDPDFLLRLMDALIVEEVNEHAIKMFGAQDRCQLLGPSRFFWQKRPDTFRRAMESRFRGLPTFQEETKFVTLDGREIDALLTDARLESIGDRGINLGGAIDIPERILAQERLQQVQADFAHAARLSVLGELAASIAHEITQPLAALRAHRETGLRW